METNDILQLAARHGLDLKDGLRFNEMGIDFKVVFASDRDGMEWVLRIPRREGLLPRIETERNILGLAKKHLTIDVPDWKIASADLIAYPKLTDPPILTYDAETYDVTWHVDQQAPQLVPSLAETLARLHAVPIDAATAAGVPIRTPGMLRQEIADRIAIVSREIGIGKTLETRYRRWLDNDALWPDFTAFIHGDLYAGHILAKQDGQITGIIDWSEGQVSDPAIDFSGHVAVFGEESLRALIREYEKRGGRIWDSLFEQAVERQAASALNYGFFAVETNSDTHREAAKAQLSAS